MHDLPQSEYGNNSQVIIPWSEEKNTLTYHANRQLKKIKRSAEYLHEIIGGNLNIDSRFDARVLNEHDDIEEARKQATRTFYELGKISASSIDLDTYLPKNDPMFEKSVYLGLYRRNQDKLLGSVRFVHDEVENTRMPIEQLPKESKALLAKLKEGTYAEVGAAAKERGVAPAGMLRLMATMVDTAHKHGVEYLGFGLEPKAVPLYEKTFGGIMQPLNYGKTVYFPGIRGGQAPYLLNIGKTMADSVEKQQSVENASIARRISLKAIGSYLLDINR